MACCCESREAPTLPADARPPQPFSPPPPAVQLTPPPTELSFSRKALPPGCQRFSYRDLQGATGNFAENAILGEGGFGKVYRGTLEDGTAVAIKCLDRMGLQGNKEFNVEVKTLGQLRHRNLVPLLGACTESNHRLAVFDYMPGGSLRDSLDKKTPAHPGPGPVLLWPARIGIALGAARGLAFLHEGTDPGLIHRDVKSSNVLIDSLGHARIADFGLALHTGCCSGPSAAAFEIQPSNEAEMLTGTFGYSAPEYIRGGRMSQKSDVYSFGVILLELISGKGPVDARQPVGRQMLVDELLPICLDGDIACLQSKIDPDVPLKGVPVPQLAAFAEVAVACLHTNPKQRPRMSEVVKFLEAIAAWKESLPLASGGGGRQTLLSLMDAMAEVPPITAFEPLLVPQTLEHPSPAAGPVQEKPSFGPRVWTVLEERTDSAHEKDRSATQVSVLCSHSASPSPDLRLRGSFGADSWPSMPLESASASPQLCDSASIGNAFGSIREGAGPLTASGQAKISGNPFAAEFRGHFPSASSPSQPPSERGPKGWTAFDAPSLTEGRLFDCNSSDPAHLWPTISQAWPDIMLSPKRPPPPPPIPQ